MNRQSSNILAVATALAAIVFAPGVALADHDDWREHGWGRGYGYGRDYGWGRGYGYRDYDRDARYGWGRGYGWDRYGDYDDDAYRHLYRYHRRWW